MLCVCLVVQSCPTLCDPVVCSPPGSSIHGILQARILEWFAISFSRDLPNPGIKPRFPTLQADSLPSKPTRKSPGQGNLLQSLNNGGSVTIHHLSVLAKTPRMVSTGTVIILPVTRVLLFNVSYGLNMPISSTHPHLSVIERSKFDTSSD